MKIDDQLRQAIRRSGLTLYALGKLAGVGDEALGRFLKAERDLTMTTAARICDVLGLTLTQARAVKKRTPGRVGHPPLVDVAKAARMRLTGMPVTKIAEHFGVTRVAIYQALKRLKNAP